MRIAILGTRGIPASYGGFETVAQNLSTRLVQRGFGVAVFCENASAAEFRGVQLIQAPSPKLGPAQTIIYDACSLWKARKDFDVVYMLGYGCAFLCWLPKLWGAKVWINMDGLEWQRAKWNRVARTYLHMMEGVATRVADRMIADAGAIRDSLRSRYQLNVPCDVIPYGCDVVEAPPDTAPLAECEVEPQNYYLAVCRFEPENHVREIIDGFLASGSDCDLVLVGDHRAQTVYAAELRKYTHPQVRFVGTIYDEARIQALRYHCRAYLHGHSVGGTNPSLLEALASSNLIVAHDNVFNREVLSSTGLFFQSPADLASQIHKIDTAEIDAAQLKASARERALTYYGWTRIADAYNQLLASAEEPHAAELNLCPAGTSVAGQSST